MNDGSDTPDDDVLAELILYGGVSPADGGDPDLFADAYDDLLDGALSSGAQMTVLVELATAAREQGDSAAAAARFRQVQALDPANPAMLEFYRSEYGTGERRRTLIAVLAAAVRSADDPRLREELIGLLEVQGKWRELIRLLEREIDELPPEVPAAKIELYRQIARIYGAELRQEGMVVQTYRSILALDAAHRPTLEALEELFEERGRWKDLVEVLLARIEHATGKQERIDLLLRAADLCLGRTGNPARAYELLERAVELEPAHARALALLAEVCERRRSWGRLLEVLERQASLATSDVACAQLLARMAKIAGRYLAAPGRAIGLWRAVLERAPDDLEALAELERLLERQGDWAEVIALTEQRLARTEQPSGRIVLLMRQGRIWAEQLDDDRRAAETWQRVLEIDPGHAAARRALVAHHLAADHFAAIEDLFLERRDIEGLAGVLAGAADRHADPAVQRRLWLRAAELYLDASGGRDRALALYQRVLAVDPGCQVAARALARTFRRRGEWSRLVDVLAALGDCDELARMFPDDAELLPFVEKAASLGQRYAVLAMIHEHRRARLDPGDADWVELTYQIGEIHQRRLGDGPRAVAVLAELLERAPGERRAIALLKRLLDDPAARRPAARLLRPHLRDKRSWSLLARALEILIEGSVDPDERQRFHRELIDVLGGQRGKEADAIAALAGLLEQRPADRQLWDRLVALGARADLAEQVAELLGRAYWSADLEPADKVALANRLARFLDRELGRLDQAEVYYWRVLKEEPANADALEALENNYTVAGRWSELHELFRVALEGALDSARANELRQKVCRILDEIQGDVPRAIEAYRELLEHQPDNQEARVALERLYADGGRWKELYGLLYARLAGATGREAAELRLRLGRIAEQHLGRPDAALIFYGQVLAADRSSAPARQALRGLLEVPRARPGAARLLREVYEEERDWPKVIPTLAIELENPDLDVDRRVELLLRLAELLEREAGDVPRALELYRLLLGSERSHPAPALAAAVALTRLHEDAADPEQLLAALGVVARLTDDPVARQRALERTAELQEATGTRAEAIETYRRLIALDGEDLRALRGLERLLEREQRWLELIDVLRCHARVEPSKRERAELFSRVTRLAGRLR